MILLIHGPPASGKSTLASSLSTRLGIPHLSTDNIGEWLADVAGEEVVIPNRDLRLLGHRMVFKILNEISKGNSDVIVEGCFNPQSGREQILSSIQGESPEMFEVFLTGAPEIMVDRYRARAGTHERHQVHGDELEMVEKLREHLKSVEYTPFHLSDQLIVIDSTDGGSPTEILECVISEFGL